ncbi:MAG: aldehyde dehydrogenase family protein [Solirubrobacterales bacterium]|nr:aldehyde dehydrogenase family protein [Solirubrobacterales bacterium]
MSTATEGTELDSQITRLTNGAAAWASMGLNQRIDLLARTHSAIAANAEAWAESAIRAKGVPAGPLEGEEWMSGPYATLLGVQGIIDSLKKLAAGKSPLTGARAKSAPGGRVAFKVLPSNLYEFNLFNGFSAELWLAPGKSEASARANAGLGAKRLGENGGVGLVLGAGNISAIGPLDVLYELIAYNRVSVLKLNPTFAPLTDAYQRALAPLIDADLLAIVNGGAEVGSYLTGHAGISHVHITGSAQTHDAIVWGPGAAKTGEPKLDKPISSELGGVSPTIVIPGEWSEADLRFQAEHVATQRLHNGGHNCIATQQLILSADWPQKNRFLNVLREVLAEIPARDPWYPGTERKLSAAERSYPAAEHINGRLLVEVSDQTSTDLCATEYFGPVLGYTAVPGSGADFFANAVEFANTKLDGSLGATIIVAPADRKALGSRFDELLAELRYGTIGVNVWSGIGFLLPTLAWGAYPGNTLEAVGSGIGVVHNCHLVEGAERNIAYGPFRPFPRSFQHGELSLSPKPPWFVTNKRAKEITQALTDFAAAPSPVKLPGIFNQAFRG